MYYIYLIINKVNDKKYVGYTSKHYLRRFQEHKCVSKNKNNILYKAIRKYGIHNFEVRPLSVAYNIEMAKLWEQRTILCLNTFKTGYNMTKGGDGSSLHTEDYKKHMSSIMRNRKFSLETRKRMSASAKNKPKSEKFKTQVSNKLKNDPNISKRNRQSAIKGHLTKKRKKIISLLYNRI